MTVRSPIFRKLLASGFVLIASSLLVLDFYLTRFTARLQIAAVEQKLALAAKILEAEIAGLDPARLKQWALESGSRAQARITVIDPRGYVLADSQSDPETMENHADRPEVRLAAQGRTGSAIRRSVTLNRDLCYLAIPLRAAGPPGSVLRLAVPLEDLDASIWEIRLRILGASAVAALLVLAIAWWLSRRLTRRISMLQSFAEGLAAARYSGAIPPDAVDELGLLAHSLNRMAAQTRDLVDKLSLESARRELILDSMVEGVLAVDGDLRVMFCNRSFARAVGAAYPVRENMPLPELVRDPGLRELLTGVLNTGESVRRRLELPAADGRAFEINASPLETTASRGAIAILHDITDLERLERVRKDFVANVSHELRTPLTAILGYTETLLDGALEDPAANRRFLDIIQSNARRLSSIASDLLILSDLESGKSAVIAERIPVPAAIENALRMVETEARHREVRLVAGEIDEAAVIGDQVRFEQALLNLLDNAVKFNRPGGEVHVKATRTPQGKLLIAVSDTGIGIPSEDLPRIFERFYRVDKARSREVGGTGLGLAIVKHVVERMNGTVTVESELGKGSTFTMLLPAT